ncbi:hypothetical protein TVAG_182390 [Trichomonas vaginalis G3]|uniref:Glycosyl transferase family 1 domain-containing protein n=1 Tax=Trichomonas vaginalis (strain ATCC PRA-98 / G3) TaxID=412133 RepID=A2D8X7_TRIV3|nr:chitobiosyldiphosphodolichol beta-mannosyltransferase protein [Trichomonas vaginalis G3]EAY23003.1 hypothetical protein TVAG_182390 [Trichomonas vaginalis G3]KAI5518965.1 chitobiosyldiphosphodolichol beta-mannosyltransferase protein [Trichomonas vaginalis G3]|eukprot:XP_001583989.1 hypothetical protein [Trichomonas vaginalis G3]
MPRVLIFSLADLGTDFRLLRHVKSFASQPDSYVYLVGKCKTVLPSDIEQLDNVEIRQYHSKLNGIFNTSIFFIPFLLIFSFFQIIFLFSNLGKIDFVLTSTTRLYVNIIIARLIRFFKKAKFILEIRPFQSIPNKSGQFQTRLETSLPALADIRIVPSRSMQGYLQIKKINSSIIRDNPGTLFHPTTHLRKEISQLLGITPEHGLIGIPILFQEESYIDFLIELISKSENFNVPLCFAVFGGGKSQKSLEHKFRQIHPKNVKLSVLPMLADVYPQVMGACDLGISVSGARLILDVSPELIEMEWSCVPIAVYLKGCVREVVSESNGFFFTNVDELVEVIRKVFVSKEVDINSMKEDCKSKLVPWDDAWKSVMFPYLDHIKKD